MKTQNILNKLCVFIGAASLLAAATASATISYNGTYSGTLTVGAGYGDTINVASSGLGDFTSFCLNSSVYAYSGTTYNYVSSDTITPANSGGPANVTLGTAWLYSQFRFGILSGYTYGNATSANLLQQAIWYFQGSAGAAANSFVTLAESAVGSSAAFNANGGTYPVFALTLTDPNNEVDTYAQPILGMVPGVPEPSTIVAGALLLLPFGVSTVRILRKDKQVS
jgi:hypothetical protein